MCKVVFNAFHNLTISEFDPMAGLISEGIQEWLEHFPTPNTRGISDQEKITRPANQGNPILLNNAALVVVVGHPYITVTLAFLTNDNSCWL